MTPEDASKAMEFIDRAGRSFEERRHGSSSNRRAEMGMVIANAVAASQISSSDSLDAAIAAAGDALKADPQ